MSTVEKFPKVTGLDQIIPLGEWVLQLTNRWQLYLYKDEKQCIWRFYRMSTRADLTREEEIDTVGDLLKDVQLHLAEMEDIFAESIDSAKPAYEQAVRILEGKEEAPS